MAPAGGVDAPADPAVWSKIQRNWVGILFQLKSEATEEAKGGTACLNLGVTQGMAGGEAEVGTVGRKRQTITELTVAWKEGSHTRCNVKTLRGNGQQDPTKPLKQQFLTVFGSLTPLKI